MEEQGKGIQWEQILWNKCSTFLGWSVKSGHSSSWLRVRKCWIAQFVKTSPIWIFIWKFSFYGAKIYGCSYGTGLRAQDEDSHVKYATLPPFFASLSHNPHNHQHKPSFMTIIQYQIDGAEGRAYWHKTCIESSPCSAFHPSVCCVGQNNIVQYSSGHRGGGRLGIKTQWKECDKTRQHTQPDFHLFIRQNPARAPPSFSFTSCLSSPLFLRSNSHSNHTSVSLLQGETRRMYLSGLSSSLPEPLWHYCHSSPFCFEPPAEQGGPPPHSPTLEQLG